MTKLTRRWAPALAVWLWVGCGWARGAETGPVQLRWDELGPRITNKKIAFVLPDGTHVEGKVLAVEPEGLRLNVKKSSNRQIQPKGKHLVPRAGLSLVRVTEYRKLGRLLGTTAAIGVTGGIVAALYPALYEGALVVAVPAGIAAGITGAAIGGYYAGKAFDKRVTEIRITNGGSPNAP